MVKQYPRAKVLFFSVLLSALDPVSAYADATPIALPSPTASSPPLFQQSSTATAVGQALGGSFVAGLPPAGSTPQQVVTTVFVDILGAGLQALAANVNPPNTFDGTTYTEFYSFGKRVFSQNFSFTPNASTLGFTVGMAPAEIRVPLLIYPIGPVALEIDGGARFQANLQTTLTPQIGIPPLVSAIGVQLTANADAAGFIEGYLNLVAVRAGVGGQVDLVDAQANVNARFTFDNNPPIALTSGMVDFLSGQFYAFLDYFSVIPFGWKRLLDYKLYSWNGYCYATDVSLCPAK